MQVTPASYVSTGSTSVDQTTNPAQTLNQNDFLKLLVSQMENQDPLNPQSDTQMAAQMAQFTSLTQASATSSSLAMLQANSLIGSTVTLQLSDGTTANGVVQSVQAGASSTNSAGTPQIVVNGVAYNVSQILSISPTVASSTTSTTTPTTTTTTTPTTTTP